MPNISGIEQGRAKYAYDCAKKSVQLGDKYKSHVKDVPMMIKTNGLGATFAFIFSKKSDKAYHKIYNQTGKWLTEKGYINGKGKLVDEIISCDSSHYRMLTIEVLAFFNWLRRFAEGLIQGDDKNE